ncbi:hypothetical protein ACIGXM_35930 [Kitasatospora sp. NPDC052896]|uniref:hypothetical protein n=1 Tax=Kitasatospora sp. NPDC052896 TaxID=3364061 RepID=UPI0037C711E8
MGAHYYLVKPEVAGGLGPETIMNATVHPPQVSRLHYEVVDWLGDCIVQSFPCYLAMRHVAHRLKGMGFTGFHSDEAIISEADEFRELNPDGELPDLVWLLVDGEPGADDLGMTKKGQLVVSEPVLDVLRSESLSIGTFTPWEA